MSNNIDFVTAIEISFFQLVEEFFFSFALPYKSWNFVTPNLKNNLTINFLSILMIDKVRIAILFQTF